MCAETSARSSSARRGRTEGRCWSAARLQIAALARAPTESTATAARLTAAHPASRARESETRVSTQRRQPLPQPVFGLSVISNVPGTGAEAALGAKPDHRYSDRLATDGVWQGSDRRRRGRADLPYVNRAERSQGRSSSLNIGREVAAGGEKSGGHAARHRTACTCPEHPSPKWVLMMTELTAIWRQISK